MPGEPRLSSEQARRSADKDFVDGLCDRFEKRWKTEEERGSPGDLPGIEELLAEGAFAARSEALRNC